MDTPKQMRVRLAHAALALACCLGTMSVQAQDATPSPAMSGPPAANQGPQPTDPARWYVDDATAAAQLRTLHKEIGAALQEALKACKSGAAADRAACEKDARTTYQQDMANANAQRAAAHPAS